MTKTNLPAAACCVGSRDPQKASAWQKGCMLVESNATLFAEMVEETISAVDVLGIKTLIVTTGNTLINVSVEQQQQSVVSCLLAAVPVLKKYGCTIVLEPLNILVNHMGYYLSTSKQGFEILRQVGSEPVSYTHLRAHETRHDLVCRLLLEK